MPMRVERLVMDDRLRTIGVSFLGIISCIMAVGVVVCATAGKEVPPGYWSVFGISLGALAGLLPPPARS